MGACRQGATSQPEVKLANKGTSKLHTAESIQSWSETLVLDNGRQDFRSENYFLPGGCRTSFARNESLGH